MIKKQKKSNIKGFTMVELLAIMIILAALFTLVVPAISKYVSDSRKSSYINTANNLIGGARNLVNHGALQMYDTNTTYYIPTSYIKTESGSKSPYGDFTEAYIVVIYNGRGYQYFWISNDTAGQGIKNVTPQDKLDEDLIESNIRDLDIIEKVETTGIGGRKNILILSTLGDWGEKKEATVDIDTDGNIVEETP